MPQERVACVQRATVPGDILTSGFVPAALRLAWVCRLQRPPYQDQPCPRADSHGASTGTMLSRWGSWRQVPPPGVQGGTGEPGQGLAQSTTILPTGHRLGWSRSSECHPLLGQLRAPAALHSGTRQSHIQLPGCHQSQNPQTREEEGQAGSPVPPYLHTGRLDVTGSQAALANAVPIPLRVRATPQGGAPGRWSSRGKGPAQQGK